MNDNDTTGLLRLVADIRFAIGDDGKRMQDELIAHLKEMKAKADRCDAVTAERDALRAQKDAAYLERNQVVQALSKCFPSGVSRTAIEGWSDDWHGCVYIDLPTGQVSWHFHDSQAHLFEHLPPYRGQWDGHSTEEKYRRLAALSADALSAQLATARDDALEEAARICDVHGDARVKKWEHSDEMADAAKAYAWDCTVLAAAIRAAKGEKS